MSEERIYICPTCNKVWEDWYDHNAYQWRYLSDFPRYGKCKKVCPRCIKKRKRKENLKNIRTFVEEYINGGNHEVHKNKKG